MKKILTTLAVAGLAFGTLAACEEKTPAQKAADATKDAAKKTGEAVKEAGKEVKDAAKEAAPK
jgi:predicted small lipoprotein YifL